jgi:hypothetical protein
MEMTLHFPVTLTSTFLITLVWGISPYPLQLTHIENSQAMKTRVAIFCPRRTIFFKIAMKGTWRRPEATHSPKYLQVPQRVASDKEYVLSSVLDQ